MKKNISIFIEDVLESIRLIEGYAKGQLKKSF